MRDCIECLTVHIRKKNPASRRNSTMHVSGIVSKRVFNESAGLYSSRLSSYTAHSRSIWSIVSVWPQWWHVVGGPRDKIWNLVALVWPIRNRVITTSWALVKCWSFVGGPSVGFKRYRSLPCWIELVVLAARIDTFDIYIYIYIYIYMLQSGMTLVHYGCLLSPDFKIFLRYIYIYIYIYI